MCQELITPDKIDLYRKLEIVEGASPSWSVDNLSSQQSNKGFPMSETNLQFSMRELNARRLWAAKYLSHLPKTWTREEERIICGMFAADILPLTKELRFIVRILKSDYRMLGLR